MKHSSTQEKYLLRYPHHLDKGSPARNYLPNRISIAQAEINFKRGPNVRTPRRLQAEEVVAKSGRQDEGERVTWFKTWN
jgi:hypothetical protein